MHKIFLWEWRESLTGYREKTNVRVGFGLGPLVFAFVDTVLFLTLTVTALPWHDSLILIST
ncbi:hypothetical protein STEG23_034474, partial [Scotinomys teguina]